MSYELAKWIFVSESVQKSARGDYHSAHIVQEAGKLIEVGFY